MNSIWIMIIILILKYRNSKYKSIVLYFSILFLIFLTIYPTKDYTFLKEFKYELQANFTNNEIQIDNITYNHFNNIINLNIDDNDIVIIQRFLPTGNELILNKIKKKVIFRIDSFHLLFQINI